ncbi:M20 family metallopeptidase [Staphylococcus kloosii]|uniref:N-acetyl-L,L-diaminopimelate deacetylase n=1 Tax=Staphylococcus kloosii TaxID=29384 RepID=A0ABQ0XSP2_9STAP|nr:M20 family metallopeptidase [Staphylococcus kloosii]AVQ37025.1 amidohydrolase [Staphylococcus kloosii]MBF7028477.1 amidohydrolase [Staphylococcus kloosii]PNZ08332.1 amidohydrolase [Staphylococcus kloosii]PTJ79457.1 amidohydrolase [Staphylococcus kloosii]SUM50131.1 peptidase [Staphylococcus kloosii]
MFDWYQLANKKEDKMIQIRRYLHQYPELSFEETHTHDFIVNQLKQWSCDITEPVGRNGIVATFNGTGDGPTIALRADFDALPVEELTTHDFKSKIDGVMHACGHDGHTAILLAVAEIINDNLEHLNGNVVLIFQYGEEMMPGGSQEMIDDGCLKGVDRVYGNHLWSGYPTGTIYSREGAMMASPDEFSIKIQGQGGHGAKPHETIDPVVVLAEFILSAQKIVSRTIDPVKQAVVSFGMIQAGSIDNVIPDAAYCKGTVRTFDTAVQQHVIDKMEKLLAGLAVANDITYSLDYVRGYLPLHNNPKSYNTIKTAANDLNFRFNDSELMMIGEDFSHYLKVRPGAFFLTGCGNPQKNITASHHSPYFDIDESSLKYAASTFLKILELEQVFKK